MKSTTQKQTQRKKEEKERRRRRREEGEEEEKEGRRRRSHLQKPNPPMAKPNPPNYCHLNGKLVMALLIGKVAILLGAGMSLPSSCFVFLFFFLFSLIFFFFCHVGLFLGFDLGLVGLENEERRKKRKNWGLICVQLIWRMKNEGRKGRTMGQQERKSSV